jgi:hypothetical protein
LESTVNTISLSEYVDAVAVAIMPTLKTAMMETQSKFYGVTTLSVLMGKLGPDQNM